jgi:hypothetical protein
METTMGKDKSKGKKAEGEVKRLEAEINKGLTKHQALNAACGAGSVTVPMPK